MSSHERIEEPDQLPDEVAAGAQASEPVPAAPAPAATASAPRRDPALMSAVRMAGISTLVLTVLSALAVNPVWAIGTLIGGALATVNLILFIRLGEAFISQQGKSAPWGVLGAIKLLGLFACVFIILRQESVSALAFVIGYGALPIGISLSTLLRPKDSSDSDAARH